MKRCPHCRAELPEEASFCPHCAQSVNQRAEPIPPRPLPRKLLYRVIAVALVAAVALGVWLVNQPKTYEGVGEVIYTDADGTYQLLLKQNDGDRFTPVTQVTDSPEEGAACSLSLYLRINHRDTGADAAGVFLPKVDAISVESVQDPDSPGPWTCSPAWISRTNPEIEVFSELSCTAESGDAQQVWTLTMKNGDTIVLRMPIHLDPVPVYHYYPEDAPMDTAEDLQALADRVDRTVEGGAAVYFHLPAVTYEGELTLPRPVNLCGNTEGEGRTVFRGGVRVPEIGGRILTFDNVDFVGDGAGCAVSAADRVHLRNCTFTGWETGVLAHGPAWVNARDCRFADNGVGLHFNAKGVLPTYTQFTGSKFTGNGTAVLLERVPGEVTLGFPQCLFSGNTTDIDNRCGQSLDISKAVFS